MKRYVSQDQRMDDLEDVAYLKRRVSELEDNQETIVMFLTKNFPKKANQLKKILQVTEEKKKPAKSKASYSSFGQENEGLSTEEAVMLCLAAKPVTSNSDPILSKVGISRSDKPEIPAGLRG